MSQNERILARLKMGQMCSLEPLEWTPRITRTAARVLDLKDTGHTIIAEDCRMHTGKTARHSVYRLVVEDQMRLAL